MAEYTAIKQLVRLECAQTAEVLIFDPIVPSENAKAIDWIRLQFNDGSSVALRDRRAAIDYLESGYSKLSI
jgi:hypothetical protein